MKNLINLAKKLIGIRNEEDSSSSIPKCDNCENWGSLNCPNSWHCYSTKDKPYFKLKKKK